MNDIHIQEGQIYRTQSGILMVITKKKGDRIAALFRDGSVIEFDRRQLVAGKQELVHEFDKWEDAVHSNIFMGAK